MIGLRLALLAVVASLAAVALPLDLPVEVRFEPAGEAAVPVFRPRMP